MKRILTTVRECDYNGQVSPRNLNNNCNLYYYNSSCDMRFGSVLLIINFIDGRFFISISIKSENIVCSCSARSKLLCLGWERRRGRRGARRGTARREFEMAGKLYSCGMNNMVALAAVCNTPSFATSWVMHNEIGIPSSNRSSTISQTKTSHSLRLFPDVRHQS